MHNHWRGSLEFEERRMNSDRDKASISRRGYNGNLAEARLSRTQEKKKKYVDLECSLCSRTMFKRTLWSLLIAFVVIRLPTIEANAIPKVDRPLPPSPENYTNALHKALLFFNAQKSGKLPKNNGIPWRGDSGLQDGSDLTDVKGGLVGGYYDAGDNIKFHFPMSFAMTMLSWSVIEYKHKYRVIGEYNHVRDLIKWGNDYLLRTFNSSATKIDKIHCQVGGAEVGSTTPDDHYCWQRPEDMNYPRPVMTIASGPDLAGEMAASMAAASIVFSDNPAYSKKLRKGARTVFTFGRDIKRRHRYSRGNPSIETFYNSTGYYDEYMWGAAWLFYATGDKSYFNLATNPGLSKNSRAFDVRPDSMVLSWDNKLPAAMLLLTRSRLFLKPGYPYEDMLKSYDRVTELTMCSYLRRYNVFNWTRGGMIELNGGRVQNLQYTANAAFLASVFADYLNATGVHGWFCGSTFFPLTVLKDFATSQINYILGSNPGKMSYVVGYGSKYPKRVHHRGASIPGGKTNYSCTGGWRWRDANTPDPNTLTGAMVGGPYPSDDFKDDRRNYSYTEPTLAGNAGLVAALVSLATSGGTGVDKNSIFAAVPPMYSTTPPPPSWKP